VRLTEAGGAERAELDRRSDKLVADVERLLTASLVPVAVTDPRSPEAQGCLTAYAAELAERFDNGYDPARTRRVDAEDIAPPGGLLLVAFLHGEPVGCCALRLHGDGPAEIKRMWVAPEARGLGLGRRLIAEVEAHARSHGVRVLRLDTNRALVEAISLYRTCGYLEVPRFNDEPYAHHWFEKALS
jgi:GNAT superfamily N-acetyltransferase